MTKLQKIYIKQTTENDDETTTENDETTKENYEKL